MPHPTLKQDPFRRALLRAAVPVLLPLPRAWAAMPATAHASAASAASTPLPAVAAASAPPPGEYGAKARVAALAAKLARANALPEAWVAEQLARARFNPAVVQLMLPGRPMQKNWALYRSRFVEPARIAAGVAFAHRHARWLRRTQRRFGVPEAVLLGILGVETYYGRIMGSFHVLDALTTLALDWPAAAPTDRSAFFASQLGDFLRWCRAGERDPRTVLGSYAGAIGMAQFMPESILRWGMSSRRGAAVDLGGRAADAILSIGNFLAGHGWTTGQPCGFALSAPPAVDAATLERLLAPDIVPSFSATQLEAAGLKLDAAARAYPGPLSLLRLPNGDDAPSWRLGTANFYVLTRYNHSALYAQAVLDLGSAVVASA
ncbi:membrane-bound lytic murein transglycosylase B precursor [mine drainage metagenome]|uniref:Membrane-bound lytic murein transglycosylase B n=1 Tax=mine drainage metagenome TaxID=410659 RepID=A0A1J5QKR4_9ZZZZ